MERRNKKAFTIIELIVVIAILGILVLLGMNNFTGNVKNAKHTKVMVATKTIEDASGMYHMDNDDWPRLTDEPYTSDQLEAFATKFYDNTGKEITLDPEGNYYDIDYDKLSQYAKAPENKKDYILQNPVGKIFYMENLNEAGENRVDYIAKKQTNTSIPSVPVLSDITENSVIVTGQKDTEVRLNDGAWFNSPHTFTNLEVNTEYTVYARFKATSAKLPSEITASKFTTNRIFNLRTPSVPTVSKLSSDSVLITGELGTEIRINDGKWMASPYTFEGINVGETYITETRFKETETHLVSKSTLSNFKAIESFSQTHDFRYIGRAQNFTLQSNKKYKLEVWGAKGGGLNGGKGGYSVGLLQTSTELKATIYVGSSSGYNGGGRTYYNDKNGGGATDIRLIEDSLYSRVIVAGGGGGEFGNYIAGVGGGLVGLSGQTQNTDSIGGTQNGGYQFGQGGPEGQYSHGGGGGGWFGGEGGGVIMRNGSGAGGSGYTHTLNSYKPTGWKLNSQHHLSNTNLISGNQSMPSPNGDIMIGNPGDGFARITMISEWEIVNN